jgi:hypothetical protein
MACPSRKRSGRAFAFMRSSRRSAHIGSIPHAHRELFCTNFKDFSLKNYFSRQIRAKKLANLSQIIKNAAFHHEKRRFFMQILKVLQFNTIE